MNVDYAAIAAAVRGRRLSEADIHMLATESACPLAEVKHCLQDLVKQQAGIWLPAVARERRGWVCNRCGGRECQEWPSARGWAATCLRCRSMGAVTSLQLIYQDQRALCRNDQPVRFCPEFLLTEAQECAAQEVLSFVQGNEARALLWAACGAGKTEVCFPALAWALERGYSVLIAAPRRDVIDDIAPRLRHDFPDVPMQVLTGSSTERFASGVVVVVATTHQVLRFARVFDWVILDEVDAFPYRDNEMLRWGLENALVEGGKLLCLTATPAVEQFRQMKKGLLAQIRLPARHHRRALPVPVWERCVLAEGDKSPAVCPEQLAKRIRELADRGPVLIFVPRIVMVETWVRTLRSAFTDWPVEGSHSRDAQRPGKIADLKAGVYRIFVSTLILERGITIDGVQVIILAADHAVFETRALVQMAGRAGRTAEHPEGSVYYLSRRKNRDMQRAIQQIQDQNALACARNLLDAGGIQGV